MAKSKPITPELMQAGASAFEYDETDIAVPKCNPGVGFAAQEENDSMDQDEEGDS